MVVQIKLHIDAAHPSVSLERLRLVAVGVLDDEASYEPLLGEGRESITAAGKQSRRTMDTRDPDDHRNVS
jgi:hypothetical protein